MLARIAVASIVVLCALGQRSDLRAAQSPAVMFYGLATESCGTWTAELPGRTSQLAQAQTWWVLGFVSGASATLATERNIAVAASDSDGIKGWITKYCADHPLDTIPTATSKLVAELRARAKP